MVKFFLYSLLAWAAGICLLMTVNILFIEIPGRQDVIGFIVISFIFYTTSIFILYLPLFTFFRRYDKLQAVKNLPVITALLINLPLYLICWLLSGKAFQPTEALLFMALFCFIGFLFALGYKTFMRLS